MSEIQQLMQMVVSIRSMCDAVLLQLSAMDEDNEPQQEDGNDPSQVCSHKNREDLSGFGYEPWTWWECKSCGHVEDRRNAKTEAITS